MVLLGYWMAQRGAERRLGIMERPYESTWFNIIDITLFAVLMIGAIALVTRHKEWHRRFVFVAALRDRRCHTMGSWMCLVAASLAESSAVVISAEMFRGVLAP